MEKNSDNHSFLKMFSVKEICFPSLNSMLFVQTQWPVRWKERKLFLIECYINKTMAFDSKTYFSIWAGGEPTRLFEPLSSKIPIMGSLYFNEGYFCSYVGKIYDNVCVSDLPVGGGWWQRRQRGRRDG